MLFVFCFKLVINVSINDVVSHILKNKLLFCDFYSLKNNYKQNSYLMGLMVITDVKRKRHGKYNDSENSRQQVTICLSLPGETGNIVQVCKNLFIDIFGVSRRKIETLVESEKKSEILYTKNNCNKKKKVNLRS